MVNAPVAVSAVVKDLKQYAVESGISETTLLGWIENGGLPAVKVGHRWLISPLHALQWFEEQMTAADAAKIPKSSKGVKEEKGEKPKRIRGTGLAQVGQGPMEGYGGRPPQIGPGL